MLIKWLKRSVLVVVGVFVLGGLLFGKDVVSYVSSSAKSVQNAVKDSVPVGPETCWMKLSRKCMLTSG